MTPRHTCANASPMLGACCRRHAKIQRPWSMELFQTVKGNTEEEACDGAQGLLRTVIEPQVDVEHAISTAPSGSQRIGLWIEMAVLERDTVSGLQRQRTRGSRWQRERGLQRQRLR